MLKASRYFLPIFILLAGVCNNVRANQNSFACLSLKNLSNSGQVSSILKAQKASSVSVISYNSEKLNRILNDSFIEMEEEVKEKDHEDDNVISLEIFSVNIHFASLAATRTLPANNHFFFFASERYLVFQTFRI